MTMRRALHFLLKRKALVNYVSDDCLQKALRQKIEGINTGLKTLALHSDYTSLSKKKEAMEK